MWHTEIGDRILKGAEAKLFAEALLDLVDDINLSPEDDYKLGVPVFDNLTYNQKISILAVIGNGLFKEDVPVIQLSALNEGAIASVFEHVKNRMMLEIEEDIKPYWRALVREASIESGLGNIPPLRSRESEEWDCCIESLSEQVLWDSDYLEDNILDDSPEKSSVLKKALAINEDYFIDIPPDPDEKETKKRLKELQQLCVRLIDSQK
jgi:hypothetical protein